jgi:hypothetical protein
MGRACGRYEGEVKKCGGGWVEPEGKRTLGRHMLYGRIILKWIFNEEDGGVNWNDVSQGRDRWQPLVNAEMNLRFP